MLILCRSNGKNAKRDGFTDTPSNKEKTESTSPASSNFAISCSSLLQLIPFD
jgi:hypothetical protein